MWTGTTYLISDKMLLLLSDSTLGNTNPSTSLTFRPLTSIDILIIECDVASINYDYIGYLDNVDDMIRIFTDYFIQRFDRHFDI